MKELVIRNGYMVDPKSGTEGYYDLLIREDTIAEIAKPGTDFACKEELDATGLVVAPGIVDVHVHFRDPGFTYKEDIVSGAKAAAAGGVTTVVLMANTKPAVDNVETLQYVMDKGRETAIRVYTCANVTMGLKGEKTVPFAQLAQAGAVGFTDDGIPILDKELLKEAMQEAAKLDLPISLHEEDPALIANNGINRGRASEYFGIGGSPREAEITMVARDLELALLTGAHTDIQHISTKEAVELVRQAKKKGDNIHAEATPHHIALTEEAAIRFGTMAKMNPPLREEADRLAIIEGLRDGTIDMIATDHAPHADEEKAKPVTEAPSGIIGLETALPLALTHLVIPGHLSLAELFGKMAYNPAKLYHLDAGYLAEGGPADLVLFDKEKTTVPTEFVSKSQNSPFGGMEVYGTVRYTICKGNIIYQKA